MDHNGIYYIVSGMVLVTIIFVCRALRDDKMEVDNVLQEQSETHKQTLFDINKFSLTELQKVASQPVNQDVESVINFID